MILHPSIVVIDGPTYQFPVYKLSRKHRGCFVSRDLNEFIETTKYVEEISQELWDEQGAEWEEHKRFPVIVTRDMKECEAIADFNPTW